MSKVAWLGELLGVQPRIDLLRSFDQRQHSYLGYLLILRGEASGEAREFSVRIGPGAQAKHAFRVGDRVSGVAHPVPQTEREIAQFYKASALRLISRSDDAGESGPPWRGVPPALEVYRERGHRRLDARTYAANCGTCHWGCRMPVEMIIDQWKPNVREYRFEMFCYGPKSCALYRAGPTRRVPGRKGMSWEEEDWVDEEATEHRGADE
ncbi:MAG: hypothetical protein ACREVG_06025 [Burkholderiales bacterium]